MCSSKSRVLFIVFFCLVLLACQGKRERLVLYNIDSLITAQAKGLAELQAKLHKEAFVGTGKDDTLYRPETALQWEQELEAFYKLRDLNKRVSRSSYIIDDSLFDVSSNLTVRAISAVEDLPVKYLRIFYNESISSPRRIEALYKERNQMYATDKILTMEFQTVNDRNILTSYSIQGGQKMIMADSVTYVVRGKIEID
jgi:hypothetical protein